MKILVIDDSEIACMQIKQLLSAHGHQVSSTASPIGVTRRLLQESIDAVILDVNLPSMRGDHWMRLLRGNPRLSRLTVILVSGMEQDELQHIAEECDADGAICKADLAAGLASLLVTARLRRDPTV